VGLVTLVEHHNIIDDMVTTETSETTKEVKRKADKYGFIEQKEVMWRWMKWKRRRWEEGRKRWEGQRRGGS